MTDIQKTGLLKSILQYVKSFNDPLNIEAINDEAIELPIEYQTEIISVLESPKVKNAFKEFSAVPILTEEEDALFNENYNKSFFNALKNTYMMELPNNQFGKTLCNNFIVLSLIETEIENSRKAAIVIIFLHEFSHFFQRSSSIIIKENFTFNTPPNKTSSRNKAECWLEERLVGRRFTGLTPKGATYFLTKFKTDIEPAEFIRRFEKRNKRYSKKKKGLGLGFLPLSLCSNNEFLELEPQNCYFRK